MKTLDYLHLNEKKVADVVSALHQLLADFQVHYTNLRGFHWDIKGHGFFVLHGKFEDMYNDAAEKVDEIAERILMLGGTPENKFSEYLKVAKVKEIYKNEEINDIDGVKIDFADKWVHLRKSNTEPIIRVYSEASTMEAAEEIGQKIIDVINELAK